MVISMDKWKGEVAVVTGASAGCGAAISEALVKAGMQVVGLARRKSKLDQLAEKLSSKISNGKFVPIQADITNERDLIEAFEWTRTHLGAVSVLVNNAGISQPTTLADGNTDMWKRILDTNVIGLSIATREAIKQMRAAATQIGHIIHVNSVLGHYVAHVPKLNMYAASKFAVTALTETLRQELVAENSPIRVTSLSPGPVDTEFASANNLFVNKEYEAVYAAMPKLTGEDVADAVIYILSTPSHVQIHELMMRPLGEPV